MKKIILTVLTILLLFSFCSCGKETKTEKTETRESTTVAVTEPTDNSVNGYRISPSANTTEEEAYYANKNTKKFHKSSCDSVSSIKESNLYTTYNRDELIDNGYSPCSKCNP